MALFFFLICVIKTRCDSLDLETNFFLHQQRRVVFCVFKKDQMIKFVFLLIKSNNTKITQKL